MYLSSLGAFLERDEIDEKLYESHLEYEDFLNLLKLDKILPTDQLDRKRYNFDNFVTYVSSRNYQLAVIHFLMRTCIYFCNRIIGNKLTMYSLTKAAAENIFIRKEISVPVVIFRFSLGNMPSKYLCY